MEVLDIAERNFFRRSINDNLKYKKEDYDIFYVDNFSNCPLHEDLCQKDGEGFVLSCDGLDSAILTFKRGRNFLDCSQIQGGKNRFRELLGVYWHNMLLDSFVEFGKNDELVSRLQVVPSYMVEDLTKVHKMGRFIETYDNNAKSFGFVKNDSLGRYVLDVF